VTVQEAIQHINGILENVVNCTGPERDTLRLAVNTIKQAVAEKKEDIQERTE
jgi:hypothetical protein